MQLGKEESYDFDVICMYYDELGALGENCIYFEGTE